VENLLLFGPSGVGRTYLAIAITMAMETQDQSCRFLPATTLVQVLQKLDRYALLVISKHPFREWDDIFPSGSMTVAAVDRLVHHSHIIGIKGESYRQKAPAARVSRNPGDPPTSLTRAPWRAQSTPAPVQPTDPQPATGKLAHRLRQSAHAAN
jgi:DNA replication protein DnaC